MYLLSLAFGGTVVAVAVANAGHGRPRNPADLVERVSRRPYGHEVSTHASTVCSATNRNPLERSAGDRNAVQMHIADAARLTSDEFEATLELRQTLDRAKDPDIAPTTS